MQKNLFPCLPICLWMVISILPTTCIAETNHSDSVPNVSGTEVNTMLVPLRIGVVGLVHTHVHWILGRPPGDDIEIVGIVEPNRELAKRFSERHGFSMDLVFDSIEEMISAKQPEAVTAFNTIYDHLAVVKYCAPRGIHVMVEKPLSVNLAHAIEMAELARKHNIQLLTNYETTWYPTTHEAGKIVQQNEQLRELQKINFFTGHQGPVEIGCNAEFVDWLTDPRWNGGGALTDFGCYGANLATWFLQGAHPTSVVCTTRQFKPKTYPKVEDDATVILNYPTSQVVIQASWNWSHNRKEMELFGPQGYVKCFNGREMSVLLDESKGPKLRKIQPRNPPLDPFNRFHKVVKEKLVLEPYDPSSLENNLIVMRILESAKIAAAEARTVDWQEVNK